MREYYLTCADVEVLMQDYLDGYLLPSQKDALENHLSRCLNCAQELVALKKLEEDFIEATAPVEVPEFLESSIMRGLPRDLWRSPWYHGAVRTAGMAVTILLVVVLSLITVYSPGKRDAATREVEIVFYSPGAQSVNLVGDFNDWDIARHPMFKNIGGTWRLNLHLPPGIYQYNFYLDGNHWADNPGTQAFVNDGFGGKNGLLFVEG